MRDLAWEHPAARLDDADSLARMSHLRSELRILGAEPARDLVDHRSDVIHAINERIVVEGPQFVLMRLTPAAYRHGLALALPDAVMARPTGVGSALTAYRMPIEGRDEWIARSRDWHEGRDSPGSLSRPATRRQIDVLAAFVAAGSVSDAARLVGIRPDTGKRHLADLRARSGLTTEQLI